MVVTFRQVGVYNFMEMRKWGLYTSRLRRVSTILKAENAGHVPPETFFRPVAGETRRKTFSLKIN